MLARIQKGADRLTSLSAMIGSAGLITAVVVILVDVIGRLFGSPLTGAQDIPTMAMVLIVFGGMALCDKIGGHVAVDLLESSMPSWMIRAGDIASALLGAVIFAGIAWTTWTSVLQMRGFGIILKTNIIGLPFDWFKLLIVAASPITAIGMILRVVSLVGGAKHHGRA